MRKDLVDGHRNSYIPKAFQHAFQDSDKAQLNRPQSFQAAAATGTLVP